MLEKKIYKGKNAWWLIAIFIAYNILPIMIGLTNHTIISNIWWYMVDFIMVHLLFF